jgi:hypothetical protein
VSIPVTPGDAGAGSSLTALFRQVHQQLRDEITGLDDETLNWVPVPGANSIATIVTHLVGSEAETFRCVAGVSCERDRRAEFAGSILMTRDVLRLLDDADDLITDLEPQIDASRLTAQFSLPTLPAEEVRPGLIWLIGNYGHAKEHVGHVQLTKQLRLR